MPTIIISIIYSIGKPLFPARKHNAVRPSARCVSGGGERKSFCLKCGCGGNPAAALEHSFPLGWGFPADFRQNKRILYSFSSQKLHKIIVFCTFCPISAIPTPGGIMKARARVLRESGRNSYLLPVHLSLLYLQLISQHPTHNKQIMAEPERMHGLLYLAICYP